MLRHKIQIDSQHSLRLMIGEPIAIKIPKNAEVLELRLATGPDTRSDLVKLADVLFNGRSGK